MLLWQVIEYISKTRESKTMCILEKWSKNDENHTIGELWTLIKQLGREDVLKSERVNHRTSKSRATGRKTTAATV